MSFRILAILGVLGCLISCKKESPNVVVDLCPEVFQAPAQILIGEAVGGHIKNDSINFPILSRADYPAAYEYVDRLFMSMVNTEPVATNRDVYNWKIHIIHNDSMRTAFFLPGGEFFVYTGLLKFLDSEHQLLSIIAHELYYANTEIIPITIKDKEIIKCIKLGDITLNREVPEAADIALEMPTLDFPSDAVMAADSFAINLLCPFLYEPLGIREIILKAAESEKEFQWLEYRHANGEERLQAAGRLAADCDLGGVRNEEAYQQFKTEELPD